MHNLDTETIARSAPYNGAIWDYLSEQHKHQLKAPYSMPNLQIRCKLN